MAPKRHGGPAQSAGKGYVKAGRPDERQASGASGVASGGEETVGSEPPVDVPFEEASDAALDHGFGISRFAAGTGIDA